MNNKERAYLTGLAANEPTIFQLGKNGLTPEFTAAIDEALAARELVKFSVLKNCMEDPHEIADTVAGRTRSKVVRVIGRKIILYRPAKEPKIKLM
jgi:RNA-binding protein